MKNLLLYSTVILGVLSLNSCNKKSSYCYNPPSWIIGNWNHAEFNSIGNFTTYGFKFKQDDIIQVTVTGETSWCQLNEANGSNSVESTTDDLYSAELNTSISSGKFFFQKISNNTIRLFQTTPPPTNTSFIELVKY
jgi:hypothetical protein